ncbi:MAG TPA: hypothetical protein VJ279_08390 [Hanamia sp.]|jgi:hypothetical protein|nr:hypothetical protein [Hanamia sp.]
MSDTFRSVYKPLSDDQKAYMDLFKEKAQELLQSFEGANFLSPDGRAMALAKTNLEQSIMWAVKSITG